jgi:hypothetical protein
MGNNISDITPGLGEVVVPGLTGILQCNTDVIIDSYLEILNL